MFGSYEYHKLKAQLAIFPVRKKVAEGLKTKDSKLPDSMKRLPIVVPTICINVPFPLLEDMIPSASRI